MVRRAGEKGFSAVAVVEEQVRRFEMQARPFDRDVSNHLNAIDPNTGVVRWPDVRTVEGKLVPWVSILHLQIRYCPFCGAALEQVIGKLGSAFDDKARKDRPLLDS